MLCRVEVPANEQLYGRFYRYRMLHRNGRLSIWGILAFPLLVLTAGVLLWGGGFGLVAPLVFGAVAAAYLGYMLYWVPNRRFREKPGAALQTEVYIFTESGYTRSVHSEEGGLPENASGRYDSLYAAVETRHDFFLFTGPSQAYLIDKAYFTNGTAEDLRALLRQGMGGKFK